MKTLTEKFEAKKRILFIILVGYAIFGVFAILRVLTDLSEWTHEHKTHIQ